MSAGLPRFDPRDFDRVEDPYPDYARYRGAAPAHLGASRDPRRDEQWWLFRHADVERAFTDPRLGRDWRRFREIVDAPPLPEALAPVSAMLDRWMLQRDGEPHARLRGVMSRAFTPRMTQRLRPRVQELAERQLAGLSGTFDLVGDFGRPFAIAVISELLGVPEADRTEFAGWYRGFLPLFSGNTAPREAANAAQSTRKLSGYFADMLAVRRSEDRGDLVSGLAREGAREARFDDADAIGTCILVMGAAFTTVVSMVANATVTLLAHPDALASLADEPARIDDSIDELMRFDGVTDTGLRYVNEPIELAGRVFERNTILGLVVASANRDPDVFPDPDRLDLTRDARAQLGFGRGVHFCLGASLARIEVAAALRALLARRRTLRRAAEPAERSHILGRGFRSLPIAI